MVEGRQGIHLRRRHLPGRADQRLALPFSARRPLRSTGRCGRTNPSPFLFFLDLGDFAIVELLVRRSWSAMRDGRVTIRPIAGTRPRGATAPRKTPRWPPTCWRTEGTAEHLMLLDLGRNDVGRVRASGRCGHPAQHHGALQPRDAHRLERGGHGSVRFRRHGRAVAGFPAGTVSGAPKVRAMEIIDELEPEQTRPLRRCARLRPAPTTPWIPASPCAPPWSRTAGCSSRPAPASSRTAIPTASTRNA